MSTTATPIPIYQGQDFYVPYFEVKVRNRPLGQDVVRDITRVTYKDNVKEIDNFEITINNWDAETRTFKYSDGDTFLPGEKVELWMGYYGRDRLRLMVTGQITSLRPNFPSAGQPTLTISGLNLLHSFRGKQKSRTFENKTDSQIARIIGRDLNARILPEPPPSGEPVNQYLLQDNQYDIVFLMERARRNGYDIFVIETGQNGRSSSPQIFFGPTSGLTRNVYDLYFGRSLIDFQPELTTAKQVGEVTVRGWDPVNKKKIEATVKRSELRDPGVGPAGNQAQINLAFNEKQEVVVDRPLRNKAEAKRLATEILRNNAREMMKGNGSAIGLPDLHAGNFVQIGGLGKRFSGRYFVNSTTHTIEDSGYNTKFECRREEKPA